MFSVTAIPAFQDNYIWMLTSAGANGAAVVDPGDAKPVLQRLAQQNLRLAAILITHHHPDHTGGVAELRSHYDVPIYGPADSPFSGITHPLKNGESCEVLGQSLQVTDVPGHTLDHICYFHPNSQRPQLFCGDTLFLAGCGRLFEGTPAQMLRAMQYFKKLPPQTEIYCTHEYSLTNLAFAEAVEPQNTAIREAIARCEALRQRQVPTLPSTIAQELKVNPFMRTDQDSVKAAAIRHSGTLLNDETGVFAAVRQWKDVF